MKAIVIGAGRGMRLEHLTQEIPKTMVPVLGRPMLESILHALDCGGIDASRTTFISGYQANVVKTAFPGLTYVQNERWEHNNILLSLMCARETMKEGFISTYADIVYRPEYVEALNASPHDITLACDSDWRRRYRDRSRHPETDAEKLRLRDGKVVELSRKIESDAASAEFIGVMRLTAEGAAQFCEAFDEAAKLFDGGQFREGRTFQKAYLIDLLQWMLERGTPIHGVALPGGYMEIDTLEDVEHADKWWRETDESGFKAPR